MTMRDRMQTYLMWKLILLFGQTTVQHNTSAGRTLMTSHNSTFVIHFDRPTCIVHRFAEKFCFKGSWDATRKVLVKMRIMNNELKYVRVADAWDCYRTYYSVLFHFNPMQFDLYHRYGKLVCLQGMVEK
jgi:hypothetical protein